MPMHARIAALISVTASCAETMFPSPVGNLAITHATPVATRLQLMPAVCGASCKSTGKGRTH